MMPSRGMGVIAPSKMPKPRRMRRKDGDSFEMYAEGGAVKSKGKQFVAQPKGIAQKTSRFR